MRGFRALGILVAAMVAVWLAVMSIHARAHVHGWSDEDNAWLAQQGSAIGICCSGSDAKILEDPDWVETDVDHFVDAKGNTVPCVQGSSQKNMGGGPEGTALPSQTRYCVRIDELWYAVPDSAVVKANNKKGFAIAWPMYSGDVITYIRCFMPGTAS